MKEFIYSTIGIKFNKIIHNYFKHYILINIFKLYKNLFLYYYIFVYYFFFLNYNFF